MECGIGFLLGAALALTPFTAIGQVDNFETYHVLLAKQCPAKHLELLSPGELDDLIEVNFHDALPSSLRSKLDAADKREKSACANETAGLTCFNVAYMRAMNSVGVLPSFAKMVCMSGLACKGQSDCAKE